MFEKHDDFTISIGSSNLTYGGLKTNVEMNAVIHASDKDEIVSDILGIYNKFKYRESVFVPDSEYIEKYEDTYSRIKKNAMLPKKKNE